MTPVIFRATEQWFVGVDEPTKLFDEVIAAVGPRFDRWHPIFPRVGTQRLPRHVGKPVRIGACHGSVHGACPFRLAVMPTAWF